MQPSQLNFPAAFCCNCGDTNCQTEIQHTRVMRLFGRRGLDTHFELAIPVCQACLRTTRRHPSGWAVRLFVFLATAAIVFGLLQIFERTWASWPLWLSGNGLANAALLSLATSLLIVAVFYGLRRPVSPQTSFYQPVRILRAKLRFSEGAGEVAFMKLAFTNPEYLNVFTTANRDAIEAKTVAATTA